MFADGATILTQCIPGFEIAPDNVVQSIDVIFDVFTVTTTFQGQASTLLMGTLSITDGTGELLHRSKLGGGGGVMGGRCSRGGFRGSSLGSLKPPLKLATYQQTLTELTDTHSSSLELRSAVQSRQIAQTDGQT